MPFPTTSILDSGVGADQNPLNDANWDPGADGLQRKSNQFTSNSTFEGTEGWTITTFGPDTEAYVTMVTRPTGSIVAEFFIRTTVGLTDYYRIMVTSGNVLRIFRGGTQLNTDEGITLNAGDSFGVTVTGSNPTTIQAYRKTGGTWSTLGASAQDTTSPLTTAGHIWWGFRDAVTLDGTFTNFGGGTISTDHPITATGGVYTLTGTASVLRPGSTTWLRYRK